MFVKSSRLMAIKRISIKIKTILLLKNNQLKRQLQNVKNIFRFFFVLRHIILSKKKFNLNLIYLFKVYDNKRLLQLYTNYGLFGNVLVYNL